MPKRASAQQKRHLGRVGEMPCLVCGMPAHVHHVISDGYKRLTKSHQLVTPLCPSHHTQGPDAVHNIGHARFTEIFGIDLLATAERLWNER